MSRTPALRPLQLDISRVELDAHGVRDFVWPVSRAEAAELGDATLLSALRHGRVAGEADELAASLGLLATFVVTEVMALYEATALLERLRRLGREPLLPSIWTVTPAVMEHRLPEPSALLEWLRSGPSLGSGVRRWFRPVRDAGRRVAMWPPFGMREGDAIVVASSPLVSLHSERIGGRTLERRHGVWFRPIATISDAPAVVRAFADGIVEDLDGRFDANDVVFGEFERAWLRTWILDVGSAALEQVQRARAHPRLPKELWTGTGGHPWSRLLRFVTQLDGGTVVGHDHGTGSGMRITPASITSELEACDTYITFNPAQAAEIARHAHPELLLGKVPRVEHLASGEPVPRSPVIGEGRGGNRVMILTTLYRGDRYHQASVVADLVAVDLQARLYAQLRSWGYEVILKPHPGSQVAPPAAFVDDLGVRILHGPFEQLIDEADLLLILDDSNSTVIRSALATDKPVTILDVYRLPWSDDMRSLLERRCSIVGTTIDEDNRVQVPWSDLRQALEESWERRSDRAVFETWFSA